MDVLNEIVRLLSPMSKHCSWAYFLSDSALFRFRNTWCVACLDHHRELLWQSDIVTIAMSGAGGIRTDEDRETQGKYGHIFLNFGDASILPEKKQAKFQYRLGLLYPA